MNEDTLQFSREAKAFFGPVAVIFSGFAIFVFWLLGFWISSGGFTFCLWTLFVLSVVAGVGFWVCGNGNLREGVRYMFTR